MWALCVIQIINAFVKSVDVLHIFFTFEAYDEARGTASESIEMNEQEVSDEQK